MIITYIYPKKTTNVADTGSPSHPALYQDFSIQDFCVVFKSKAAFDWFLNEAECF